MVSSGRKWRISVLPARQDHALCFDSVRQTALLFGDLSGQNTKGQKICSMAVEKNNEETVKI